MGEYTYDGKVGYGLSEYSDQIVDGKPVGLDAKKGFGSRGPAPLYQLEEDLVFPGIEELQSCSQLLLLSEDIPDLDIVPVTGYAIHTYQKLFFNSISHDKCRRITHGRLLRS